MLEHSIPFEIIQAFDQKGFTLLIKGKAGTGKTTLSLEILENFGDTDKIYISTRITPNNIVKQYPWLDYENISFIDATQTFVQDDSITHQIERAIKFREMPGFLQKVYDIIKDSEETPTVIIDSWDAIRYSTFERSDKLMRVETVLAEMVRYMKFNLVLIVESEEHYLDYISDGIVELKSEVIDNRRLRTIEIEKMRGVEISQPEYLFSLHGGRFKYFGQIKEFVPIEKLTTQPPLIKNKKNMLLSYSETLNKFFDYGSKKGNIRLLEIGEGVGFEYIWVLMPFVINQINQGYGITILPDEGLDFRIIFNVVSKFFDQETIKKYLDFFDFPPTYNEPKEFIETINLFNINDDLDSLVKSLANEMLEKIKQFKKIKEDYGGIAIFGSNRLENKFGTKQLTRISLAIGEFIKLFRTSNMVYVAHSNQKIQNYVSSMLSTHFKMERLYNTIVIYSILPFSKIHVVIPNFDNGYPDIILYPIV
jgi:KaiC/GvpD/RAD55 family RecA-like ATPase